jgi:putative tricarboxylic transport membrane protein
VIGLASGSFINAIARNGSDLNKQVTPLIKLFDAYQCYFTNVDSSFKSMVDVRDRLKADPTSVTFAFPVGLGSPLHISVVNVGKAVGAPPNKLVTVVFDSGSDVAAQAAGNHIDVAETSIGSAMPLIQGGKLRMLGIASPERLPGELAKFPTLREQGLDVVTANSYTVLVPNGLTPEQIAFWARALDKVLLDPDFKLDLDRNFWTLQPIRYPATAKWMQDDYDENRRVLTELGMLQ